MIFWWGGYNSRAVFASVRTVYLEITLIRRDFSFLVLYESRQLTQRHFSSQYIVTLATDEGAVNRLSSPPFPRTKNQFI